MVHYFALVLCKFRHLLFLSSFIKTKITPHLLWIMVFACYFLYTKPAICQNTINKDSAKTILPTDSVVTKTVADTFRIAKDAIDAIIDYTADDSIIIDNKTRRAYLYGNANVIYDGMNLKAALIIVDFTKRELYARGIMDSAGKYLSRPHFNDGERETDADTMIYNFDSKRGRTYGIAIKEGEGYILCNKVLRDNDKSIYSDLAKYTTCNLPHPHFYLEATKLKIIPDKKILFGPSNLKIEDVPTPLFIPFGMFPTKKGQKSGLIPFEYGLSGNYGAYLRNVGYYFGISDHFDQTIQGDIYFRGSWRLASNTRYASRYHYSGGLSLQFSKFLNGEREDPNFKTNNVKSFSIEWNHLQDAKAKPGTNFSAHVNIQKNNAAKLNSPNPTTIVANQFNSSISYSQVLFKNKANFSLGATHSQNTQTRGFAMSLPTVNFSVQRITPFSKPDKFGKYKWYKDLGVSYQVNAENKIDTRDSIFFSGRPAEDLAPGLVSLLAKLPPGFLREADKFKQGIVHSVPITLGSYKFIKNHFSLTPTLNYTEYWYFKTITKEWNPFLKKVDTFYHGGFSRANEYGAAVNVGTQVFGTFQLNGKKISKIRHTITPNMGFSYRPDFSEEKYGIYHTIQGDSANTENRRVKYSIYEQGIKGGPGRGPSGLFNYSIGNNLQAKVLKKTDSSSKYENVSWLENLSVAGNYNFLADSLRLSNISATAFTTLFKQLRINGNANLNPYTRQMDSNGRFNYINRLEWQESRRVGTWTNASVQLSTQFNADMFKRKKKTDTTGLVKSEQDKLELADMQRDPYGYVRFDIPWSFNVNYSMNYSRLNYRTQYLHTFSFGGDFSLAPKWKIGCNSGYDFLQKKIAYTQFSVSRSLHCWALSFNWIPDGIRKSFTFSLHANSSMLQDLKVNKRRYWFDQ